jgi:hypothetical protein
MEGKADREIKASRQAGKRQAKSCRQAKANR